MGWDSACVGCIRKLALLVVTSNVGYAFDRQTFVPPADPQSWKSWYTELVAWRTRILHDINYTGAVYRDPAVNWTTTSYVQPQTHLYDRYLYDPEKHEYTVNRYLEDVEKRYGGIDSILLWPTYTNIGIDARNQFDYFRALPGGLDGLKKLTLQFHERGVRVLWAYNPWDQSLRSEGEPHWATLAKLLKATGGDGFNGDTMLTMYRQFWDAGVHIGHHVVGEMEGGGYATTDGAHEDAKWDSMAWDTMGWGESWNDGTKGDGITNNFLVAPGVDKLKWLDGRHMTHVCDRWAKDRTDAMQYAFFNGVGYESWENVWGMFMHFTPRDGEALRRAATLLRWLGRQRLIQSSEGWEPYTPDLLRAVDLSFDKGGPMASKFVHESGDCVWLVVNRADSPGAAEINVSKCTKASSSIYDLYHGVHLPLGNSVKLRLEAHGYGALLVTGRDLPVLPLLARMQHLTAIPLENLNSEWAPLQQEMVGMVNSQASTSSRMVEIKRTKYTFRTAGVELEGGCDLSHDTWGVCCQQSRQCPQDPECSNPCANAGEDSRGVDAQFPWEIMPGRFHTRIIEVGPFYIDRYLVTKGEYAKYLHENGYAPREDYNFLVGWMRDAEGHFRPPRGSEEQPVVWVSLTEARAYCEWAGKRLPHTYEWQLAAQSIDGRLYPWGNQPGEPGVHLPASSNGTSVPPLPNIGSYSPAGDSPDGVSDLVGVVWQYTDEFRDEHTRTVLLKGSSLYTPMLSSSFPAVQQGQNWYFPKALQVNRHNRMMLMDDSYERAATLGFRCVADHANGQAAPHHYTDLGPITHTDDVSTLWV